MKGRHLDAADGESADRLPLAQEGYRQNSAMSLAYCVGAAFREFVALGKQIMDVYGHAIHNGAPG